MSFLRLLCPHEHSGHVFQAKDTLALCIAAGEKTRPPARLVPRGRLPARRDDRHGGEDASTHLLAFCGGVPGVACADSLAPAIILLVGIATIYLAGQTLVLARSCVMQRSCADAFGMGVRAIRCLLLWLVSAKRHETESAQNGVSARELHIHTRARRIRYVRSPAGRQGLL